MTLFGTQLQQVFRRLGRAPLFTIITLLTLAIGVGANTVIFSVVNGILLKPLPYPHPEQIISVWIRAEGINIPKLNMAPSYYFTYREQNTTLEDIGTYDGDAFNVTGSGAPEHVNGADVTEGVLPILGVKPVLGRLFNRQDDSPNGPHTVLISYGYWQRKFGGSQSVIGSTFVADGQTRQIIGVLPKGFAIGDLTSADIYAPMQIDRSKVHLGNFNDNAIARMKPGVTIQQVQADLGRLGPVVLRSFPTPPGFSMDLFEKAHFQPLAWSFKKDVVGDIGNVLWVLMGSIAMVLLVACANVANLLLVRVEGRRQELAVRSALGAGWMQITRELLVESFVLGIAGSLLGLALAWGGLHALLAIAPEGLPRVQEIGIDLPVLLFTFGLALFTSLLIGVIPVFKYAGAGINATLREGGRSISQSRERHRARKTLVVVQVALALVLLICSGLMIRTFLALSHVSPGFTHPEALQTFRFFIPESQIPDSQGDKVIRMEQEIRDKLAALPGVSAAAIASSVPMDGRHSMDPVFAQDHTYGTGELPPIRKFMYVSPGTFDTLGTRIVAGRDFTWSDNYDKHPVAVISEQFAREYWKTPANALGKHIRVGTSDDWREIIGVVEDVYSDGVDKPAESTVYWPMLLDRLEGNPTEVQRYVTYIVRSPRAGSQSFIHELQQQAWSLENQVPLSNVRTEAEYLTQSMARTSFTLVMLCVSGSMALLLGVIGIYGVIAYSISQRTREIGIRMALGAQRESLTALFVRQGLLLTGIGVACGLITAFLSMRLMSSLLFNVSPVDPLTYVAISLAVIVAAWLACYLPSRRAASINPVQALRSE
ncbi:ABC transporter permease [Silvibacterium sp.]|uniref:ABC transporter permease n=1 Tax=Silvibacterium sp. TaxID=1964179 RepID=UPI0039E6FE3D